MKQYGLLGKGTGKLGASVFAISGGEQIVREYNPNVTNPNTDAQVNQRTKFKLMSQLAADLASVIVIPKKGLVSARNQFVSKNIPLATSENGEASINYVNVQLTASEAAFPAVTGAIDSDGVLSVELAKMPAADVQKVVYCAFAKDDTNQLSLIGTTIIDRAEATNNFATTFENAGDAYVVYAYGIKASAVVANPGYENYEITGATDIARLVAARSITLDASGTTRTSGVLVAAGANKVVSLSVGGEGGTSYKPGQVCGPIFLAPSALLRANMQNSVAGRTPSNGKVVAVLDGAQVELRVAKVTASNNVVQFELGEISEGDNYYITKVSFDLDGENHGIRFAQP